MYHVELYRDIQVTKKNSLSGNVTVTAFIASTRCSLVHFTILTGEVIYNVDNGAQAVAFSRCRITVGYFTNCFL